MKFLTDIRLLLLGLWLGSAVYFIGTAQNAFAVLPQRELAGSVVGRNLSLLNFAGFVIAILLLLTSWIGAARFKRFFTWLERLGLLVLVAACGLSQFVIGIWISNTRQQMTGPVDELPADDPLRMQFNTLHQWSEWLLLAGMIAALITFFVIANRRPAAAKPSAADPYDFSKEFKT
jgi:hypothetical protein